MSDMSRAWTWRHLIIKSELPATTRHVLLTLSCFMNEVGGGCYPTQEDLAKASGLSDRAVRTHLDLAEKEGWLKRREHGFRGQKWRNTEYWALWPDPLDVDKGEEPRSAPSAPSSGTSFRKVRNHVPTTSPDNSNIPLTPGRAGDGEAQDVDLVFVHAMASADLYQRCCRVTGHKPSLTDKLGGWKFTKDIVKRAGEEGRQ
jgi:hypothetical protein